VSVHCPSLLLAFEHLSKYEFDNDIRCCVVQYRPFVRASLTEVIRRAMEVSRCNKSEQSIEEGKSKKAVTLLLAEALSNLGGSRLLVPHTIIDDALTAVVAGKADGAFVKGSVAQKSKIPTAKLCELSQVADLPIRIPMKEIVQTTGDAATILLEALLPMTLPHMGPQSLEMLTKALMVATEKDEGLTTHEPLRQAIGCVVAEVVGRAAGPDARIMEDSCLRSVVRACRKRLLHVKFTLSSPSMGVAEALATLEAWRSELHQATEPEKRKAARKSVSSNEAVSLELSQAVEDGEEAMSRF